MELVSYERNENLMEKICVKDLYKNFSDFAEKEVTLEGWVRTVRDSKTFGFIELNDGSFFKNVQIVFDYTKYFLWNNTYIKFHHKNQSIFAF